MTEHHAADEIEDRLWAAIDKGRFGMLGVPGEPIHFQPMTAFAEKPASQIWFFSYQDTDLARRVGAGARALFLVQARDLSLQASVGGRLTIDRDIGRIERYWDPMIASWFPEGRDDPRLTLLRLDCTDAEVWLTEAGPLKYAWEAARTTLMGEHRDLGDLPPLVLQ